MIDQPGMAGQADTGLAATASGRHALEAGAVLLSVVAIKLLILALDSNPRFFLWDSVTYLRGAVDNELPRDRSFLYSLLIKAIALPVHSLHALVVAQTLAGIASAFLTYLIMRSFLSATFGFALAGAVLMAIEPAQLLYERMVMAEAFGGAIWLGFIILVLAYIRDGRAGWLWGIAVAGIAAIAFRLNGAVVVLLVGACAPLWRVWLARRDSQAPTEPSLRRRVVLTHLAIALMATAVLHVGYRHLVGHIAHTAPGYIGTEGLFQLGFAAPVVKDQDFENTGCKPDVLKDVVRPLVEPRNRNYQLWGPDGLWSAMQRDCSQAEAAADIVAKRALGRVASSVLPMALSTVEQYFDNAEANWRIESDLGRKSELPLELIEPVKKYFFLDVAPIIRADTLTSVWFEHSRWWLTGAFLLSPLLAVWLAVVTRHLACAAQARMLALILLGLFLTQFLFSPVMEFRYLHPFPPLVIVGAIAILAHRVSARRNKKARQFAE